MEEPPFDSDDRTTEPEDDLRETLESLSLPHAGTTWKVLGETAAPDGTGVVGHNTATTGGGKGLVGVTDSMGSASLGGGVPAGVFGGANADSGPTYGVMGTTSSDHPSAAGVRAVSTTGGLGLKALSADNTGVRGRTGNGGEAGIAGTNQASSNATGTGYGVRGATATVGAGSAGVRGDAATESGITFGVRGRTSSPGGADVPPAGVRGEALAGSGSDAHGVYGVTRGTGFASPAADPRIATGVRGVAAATSGVNYSVGVWGENRASSGVAVGVYGRTTAADSQSAGVLGESQSQVVPAVEAHGRLAVSDSIAGSPSSPTEHVAYVENTVASADGDAQVMLLDMPNQGTSPTDTDNFLTFRAGGITVGAIEGDGGGGVTLDTTAGDVAEYFPLADPGTDPEAGEVLGLREGALSRRAADAEAALVVTRSAALLGNDPSAGDREEPEGLESVALLGQVPVRVSGSVRAGDRLVPSGDDDGTARAGTAADGPVVGRALESLDLDESADGSVRALVGGTALGTAESVAAENERLRRETDRKDGRIAALEAENEALRERVAAIEAHLGVDGSAAPASADD